MSFSRSAFTGFPFDDSDFGERSTRDQSFRSHIDDIVNRHPELADHLSFNNNSFPFGSNTWANKRRGSSERDSGPSANTERPENRRFGRPLRSRFEERFGFPFTSSFDEPYNYQTQEPTPQTQEEVAPKQQETQPQKEEKPPQAPPTKERNRKQNSNIQQSNTVDLGQKQEPVSDSRGQRSMSAPPENRSGKQRFVSSINIPMFGKNEAETHQQSPPQTQPQQPSSQGKGAERVIPIHVEGRDVPVVPRHDNSQFTPPPQQQQQQQAPRNNFGQRPFGHWNRGNSPYYTGDPHFYPEDGQSFGKGPYKAQKPQQPQQQQQQQKPQNVQQNQQRGTPSPQPQQSSETQLPTPPPPQQPPQKLGPIDQIKCIQKNVLELMSEVERFNGKPKDKQYMYLDEMLTRNLLKLDDVETEGKDNIRQARKEAINCIQRCISILEAKAAANEQLRNQLMQIDKVIEPSPAASLEVSGLSRSGSAVKSNEEQSTPMEVDTEKGEAPKETNTKNETNPHDTTNENEPKNSSAEEAKISEDNTKEGEESAAAKKKDGASESG